MLFESYSISRRYRRRWCHEPLFLAGCPNGAVWGLLALMAVVENFIDLLHEFWPAFRARGEEFELTIHLLVKCFPPIIGIVNEGCLCFLVNLLEF